MERAATAGEKPEDPEMRLSVENFSRGVTDGEAGAAVWEDMLDNRDYMRGSIKGMIEGGIISEDDAAALRAEVAAEASYPYTPEEE